MTRLLSNGASHGLSSTAELLVCYAVITVALLFANVFIATSLSHRRRYDWNSGGGGA